MGAFDIAMFRAHMSTAFVLDPGDRREPVTLTLVEVTEGRSGGGFHRFSVLFHGPSDRMVGQGLYTIQHQSLGTLELFLVPVIGSNAERMLYEACFSQPIESAAP
jgi:hypothetical protein